MFLFLKYIQASWYFNLVKDFPMAVLVEPNEENLAQYSQVNNSKIYSNIIATQMDISYQWLMKGVVPNQKDKIAHLQVMQITDVTDNYIFVKRYFGVFKCLYVLLIRLFSFKNPIKELIGFLKTLKVTRVNLYQHVQQQEEFEKFDSKLINEQPLVSIIIPTLNRYEYLKDVLMDLEQQDYKNFEVLICDQSEPVNKAFYQNWKLNIKLIIQEEKALWLARNKCINMAKGDYILLFDDDSRVDKDWVTSHLKCIDYFQVAISAGVTNTLVGHGLSLKEKYFHLSDVFDTGNAMVHKKVFEKVGLFDRQFEKQRMGDGEFGLRSFLGGFQIISNPFATRIHLKVETGGLRQMGSWDALRPKNIFAPRPVPSVLYLIRKYFGSNHAVFYLIQNIPFSFIPYQFKKSKSFKLFFIFMIPVLFPFMFWVAYSSWKLASIKLDQGPKIELIN